MAFGVLESDDPFPPGTSLFQDLDVSSNGKIILVPQPSLSPKDPLNWSRTRKELVFLTIVFGTSAVGVVGPVLSPGFATVAEEFDVTISKVALLNGGLVIGLGVSSYLCSCLAPVFGKRLIFLLTSLLLIITCCWAAAAQTYPSILASRVFQGLSMGGFFSLAGTASINDIFFVHERGLRVGLWNLASIASINIAPIISGYIIVNLGWRWTFWLMAITFGIALVLVLLFFPETAFDRQDATKVSATHPEILTTSISEPKSTYEKVHKPVAPPIIVEETAVAIQPQWRRVLGLGTFEFGKLAQLVPNLTKPVLILRAPAVLWACAMWSVIFSWLIFQSAISQQIFGAAPYNMDSIEVGIFVGVAPLIGALLGTISGGWACDASSRWMAVRNGGVFEPEFRLVVMLPFLVSWIVGAFGLGAALEKEYDYVVCGFFLAVLNFAVGLGCTGIVTYQNDACQKCAAECFGIAMLVKSAFAFGLTFMINDYYVQVGPMRFMATWGGLTIGVTMFTIPLYIFGKRSRSYIQQNSIF